VASLCTWSDTPGDRPGGRASDRLARARVGYPTAWDELSQAHDPTALRAERNEYRHLPLASVMLRIEAEADPIDVELCLLAARTTGTQVVVSTAPDETVDDLRARWQREPSDRLRVLGAVSEALRRAAFDAWLTLDHRRPVAEGRLELPRWCREQSVSITNHRHGNTRAG